MNIVTKILMERDELTRAAAEELINETREEILASDPWEIEDILMNNLGLEPDYIFDIL